MLHMLMKIQHLLLIKLKLTADGTAADLGASAPDGYITYGGGLILNLSRVKLMDIFL